MRVHPLRDAWALSSGHSAPSGHPSDFTSCKIKRLRRCGDLLLFSSLATLASGIYLGIAKKDVVATVSLIAASIATTVAAFICYARVINKTEDRRPVTAGNLERGAVYAFAEKGAIPDPAARAAGSFAGENGKSRFSAQPDTLIPAAIGIPSRSSDTTALPADSSPGARRVAEIRLSELLRENSEAVAFMTLARNIPALRRAPPLKPLLDKWEEDMRGAGFIEYLTRCDLAKKITTEGFYKSFKKFLSLGIASPSALPIVEFSGFGPRESFSRLWNRLFSPSRYCAAAYPADLFIVENRFSRPDFGEGDFKEAGVEENCYLPYFLIPPYDLVLRPGAAGSSEASKYQLCSFCSLEMRARHNSIVTFIRKEDGHWEKSTPISAEEAPFHILDMAKNNAFFLHYKREEPSCPAAFQNL